MIKGTDALTRRSFYDIQKSVVHPFLSHIAEESRKQLTRSKLTCGTRKDLLSAAAVKP